jgi:hypothetical protein
LSTECVSRFKQPVDAPYNVVVVDKLASVGLRDAFLHAGDEAGVIFQHASNRVFHQLLSVLAAGKGNLLKTCFNLKTAVKQ